VTLTNFLLDIKHNNHKIVLLYRLHVVVIIVNIFAIFIDIFAQRYNNASIELFIIIVLCFNLLYLRKQHKLKPSAYIFTITISITLFGLVYINHFATMSVVFILLLPLSTLLFLEIKESILMSLFLFIAMVTLLYFEYLNNPNNLLAQNPTALFNLAYTAIIIYILGLLYHITILRTFQELDTSNRQKALLLKEVHHRVKNNLNVIASIIGLQENTLEGKAKEALLKSKSRIESIAIVHEMLYKDENFENINFEIYMRHLSNLLLQMYASDKNIKVFIKSDIENMSLNVMVQLGIMINELLTNSIKYAFNNNQGEIHITLMHHDHNYTLTYADNGIGYMSPEELVKGSSLGIKLIYLTAKQLKGEVNIINQKGLKYEIKFTS